MIRSRFEPRGRLLHWLAPFAVVLLASAAAGTVSAQATPPAGELWVTFLHTSDEHSALLPSPLVDHAGSHQAGADEGGEAGGEDRALGGFARLGGAMAALRERLSAAGEPVLLTSAGDNIGGTPFAWLLLEGEAPELSLMVELGYDVITLGNHEFDYDSDRLARALKAAGYPAAAERTVVVATNTRPPPGHPLGEVGLRRTHLVTLENGLRVGFIGLLGEGAIRFATLAPPVEFDDAVAAAAGAVAELREQGAQLVVAITHSGLDEDRALARAVPGIDVILGGHDHHLLDAPLMEGGTIIVHPGAYLQQLKILQVGYDPATGRVRVRNPDTGEPYVVPIDADVEENPRIASLLDGYRDRLEARLAALTGGRFTALDQTVVRSDFPLPAGPPMRESAFGNFVTDAMRGAVAQATGEPVDFAFQANGVIRGDLVAGTVEGRQGHITVYDLLGPVGMGAGPDGQPGYPLVSVWMTGEEVRRVMEVSVLLSELFRDSYYLQVSGLRARYDPRRAILFRIPLRGTPVPTGRAVLSLEREAEGQPVPLEHGDDRLYQVVTDRYVASFLPMVGQVVPRLAIVPKRRDGSTIHDLDEAIVRRDGQELKVWEAVLDFAAAQPRADDGHPRIAAAYSAPAGRLVIERATPLWIWPLAGLLLLAGLAIALVDRLRRRRRSRLDARI